VEREEFALHYQPKVNLLTGGEGLGERIPSSPKKTLN